MVAPLAAAKAAQTAWSARGPLTRILAITAACALTVLLLPFGFAFAALALVAGADQACATELTSASATDESAILRAAQQRRTGPVGAALVAAFATEAGRTFPDQSLDAAGPFRLPAAYAAGSVDDSGRWRGPQDPATGDVARDSRQVTGAAIRAVIRRLHRTDPVAWAQLRAAAPTTDASAVTDLATVASTVFTAAFPHAPLTLETARTAISSATVVDAGGAGDLVTGGVLVIGDPARLPDVRSALGTRAFGGLVAYQPTSADPAGVGEGAWRDLAAADGLVLAVVQAAPTIAQVEDLQDATNATVTWITATGSADPSRDVLLAPGDLTAVMATLATRPGADAPVGLCDAVMTGTDITLDPALIVAPDPSAYAAIAYAQSQLGKPYSYAASPPTSWDCSKLTTAAWAVAGVHLTPLSYTQWDQVQHIPVTAVAPGDLVFWFRAGAHHVALVDAVVDGQIWITEAANPDDGVRRRALGGSWDDASLTGYGRVTRPTTSTPPDS